MSRRDRPFETFRTRAALGVTLALAMVSQGLAAAAAAPVSQPTTVTWTPAACVVGEACVVADGLSSRGRVELRGQGFLHGVTGGTDLNRVRALKPQHWRLSDHNLYDLLRRETRARITWVISDSWHGKTCTDGSPKCPLPPWENWEKYESFVRALVAWANNSGRPMDYWDIINEPGWGPGGLKGTPAQYLELLHRAHDAIRSVDPDAGIKAPSLVAFSDAPSAGNNLLDLQTFVDYAEENQLRFDAISWHENMAYSPHEIPDHAARARALLSKHPAFGTPELHVGEYTPISSRRIPGWAVGWLAALEKGDLSASFRTCWWERDPGETPYPGCRRGTIDGLLMSDERTPRPVYWAYEAYADMTGVRLSTSSNEPTISLFATKDDARKEMRILVGRHERCTPRTNPGCSEVEIAAPRPVGVRLRLPWPGPTQALVAKIPNQAGSLSAPVAVASLQGHPGIWTTLRVPDVHDGDAYTIVLRPMRPGPDSTPDRQRSRA